MNAAAKPRYRVAARTGDSFANLTARLGVGADNLLSQGTYGFDFISRNRMLLEAMYRSSWIVGQAVDVVAKDMVRAGIHLGVQDEPMRVRQFHATWRRLRLWQNLCDAIRWGRLYGGGVGILLIDGQDMRTPLRLDTVGKDQFRGIVSFDRWLVQPALSDLVTEFGPHLGLPRFYDIVSGVGGLPPQRIHHSRVLRFEGVPLPYWQRTTEMLWGQSIIERLWDRLQAFDSTTMGTAQLVFKAYLRTMKVKDFHQLVATGGKMYDAFLKRMEALRALQTSEGLSVIDANDEIETAQYTFSGLDAVLLQFGQQLSGALGIPLVRLFGQSPGGLSSTGESDLRTYYDNVDNDREDQLRDGVETLAHLTWRTTHGTPLPPDAEIDFLPLWQLSAAEKATIAKTRTDTVTAVSAAGLISDQTALKELAAISSETGVWTNITAAEINDADDQLPEPEAALPEDTGEAPQDEPDAD